MNLKLFYDYFLLKRANLEKNKGDLLSKTELHEKVDSAKTNLNVLVNYLIYKTNLVESIQSNLKLAYLSNDLDQKVNNYVSIPCDNNSIAKYYDTMLINHQEDKKELAFHKLNESYQKYVQLRFAVQLANVFKKEGFKTEISNYNLQSLSKKHFPKVNIYL